MDPPQQFVALGKETHRYVDGLFDKMSSIPKVANNFNLLHQLQKFRQSDRPISVIHHTMAFMQNAMRAWQHLFHQQLCTLMDEQKRFSEHIHQFALGNQYFNTLFMDHMAKFHDEMIPKHDRRAYEIAKEAHDMFILKRKKATDAQDEQPTAQSIKQKTPIPEIEKLQKDKDKESIDKSKKRARVERLLHLGSSSPKRKRISNSSSSQERSDRIARRNEKRAYDRIYTSVVQRFESGIDKKDRKITRAELHWVIDCIKSIPSKLQEKTGKSMTSRKAITSKYEECWKTLMDMDFPPSLESAQDLRNSVKRENERMKRMQGNLCMHVRAYLILAAFVA